MTTSAVWPGTAPDPLPGAASRGRILGISPRGGPGSATDAELLPDLVRPMLATPGALPEHDDRWSFAMKWDGVRLVAYAGGGALRLLTRNDQDVTATYPELGELSAVLGTHRAVLDGEVVALDERGRPSFGVLQQRMHVLRPSAELWAQVPVSYLVFDVLHLDGHPTTGRAYRERRALLEGHDLRGDALDTPPHVPGSGADAMRVSREQGLEGGVAKRLGSLYRPERRSPDWVKVKHQRTQDVVVVGWSPGEGRRAGAVGAELTGLLPDLAAAGWPAGMRVIVRRERPHPGEVTVTAWRHRHRPLTHRGQGR